MIAMQMVFGLCMVLFGAELFTNAIEWLGAKLDLGEGAVGSVLAALGTALPETAVPITAIALKGGHEAEQVGIGGILGAPFLLVTLGGLVIALAAIFLRSGHPPYRIDIRGRAFARDLGFFLLGFSLSLAPAVWPSPALRASVACLLVVWYAAFVWAHLRDRPATSSTADLRPLYVGVRRGDPSMAPILVQLAFALALVIGGAHLLTRGVESWAAHARLPTFLLSALVIPIATELPETLNSVLWMREGKDGLAVGNITGAMVFQSTLVPAIGMLFTDWAFTREAWWTASLTLGSAVFLLVCFRLARRLEPWALCWASIAYFALPMLAVQPHTLARPLRLALAAGVLAVAALGAATLLRQHPLRSRL